MLAGVLLVSGAQPVHSYPGTGCHSTHSTTPTRTLPSTAQGLASTAAASVPLWRMSLGAFSCLPGPAQLRVLLTGSTQDTLQQDLQKRCGQGCGTLGDQHPCCVPCLILSLSADFGALGFLGFSQTGLLGACAHCVSSCCRIGQKECKVCMPRPQVTCMHRRMSDGLQPLAAAGLSPSLRASLPLRLLAYWGVSWWKRWTLSLAGVLL